LKRERRLLHELGERRYPLRGQFSSIAKDIFFESQPLYYIMGLGVNGLTFKPFAKVRISSSFSVLYIDLGDTLNGVSKAKKRKAIRYGKGLPIDTEQRVNRLIGLTVRQYQTQKH
jgi:hypothetical protein